MRRQSMWQTVEDRIHTFFRVRGFVFVRTPLLVRSPGMEPYLDPIEATVRLVHPARTVEAGLITSPEYSMKKLLGAGMKKIYTVTPVFRNQETLGPGNLPEFTMLEWYAAGSYEDLMDETEALLHEVLEDSLPWKRLRYEQAGVDAFGEPHTDETRFFVTHYPAREASLARLSEDGTAERFEAFGNGLELCNGFCELTNAAEQCKRFDAEQEERKSLGKRVFPIDEDLLEALERIKGSVYGNALGLDRLIMLKYAASDIRDIQLIQTL